MNALLPPIAHSPFGGSFVASPFLCSTSPSTRNSSTGSIGTVKHFKQRRASSSSSYISIFSARENPVRVRDENTPPSRSVSVPTQDVVEVLNNGPASWKFTLDTREESPLEEIDLDADSILDSREVGKEVEELAQNEINQETGLGIATNEELGEKDAHEEQRPTTEESQAAGVTDTISQPFRRWMSTLRHKNLTKRKSLTVRTERWSLDDCDAFDHSQPQRVGGRSRHQKTSSHSSSAFITAVKTASASLASLSVAPRSRHAARSNRLRGEHRNSGLSQTDGRPSMDNSRKLSGPFMDEAAWDRAFRRRQILEELVSSEESYVSDLKVLTNVYFNLLTSVPSLSQHTQLSIQRNIAEILRIHEDLLRQLQDVVRDSEVNQIHGGRRPSAKFGGRVRWHSMDMSGSNVGSNIAGDRRKSFDICETWNEKRTALVAEPKQVAEVALVFQNMMNRFFAYEEYGAKYEMMAQDMAATYNSIPGWHAYERGIEALANSLTSMNGREAHSRKGLTFNDLLIKPIQRVCKYPLLFLDLHKHTPVIDCPETHSQIEKVICRLRETTDRIDKATDDPKTRDRIQKTWLLQDRLILQNEALPTLALRQLGHVMLCGVLHVAYETKRGVEGDYMVCLLFKSCLLLATLGAGGATYEITAGIGLSDLKIEETDNGRGLQCSTALYAWKVVFESDHRLFELIFSACSAREEEVWRSSLLERSAAESRNIYDGYAPPLEIYPTLILDLKSIGNNFGQRGTLARRTAVQRTATLGPQKAITCQVIIKNTHVLRDSGFSPLPTSPSMNRSQSHLARHRTPVLAPKRSDRIRVEHALSDVWTRDVLPYPGMAAVRGDHLIRASASSMMRKLSMASLTSSFAKRSASHISLGATKANEAGKELGDVAEKSDREDSEVGSFKSLSILPSTANAGPQPPVTPPPRISSACGTKRLKSNRLLKNPKLSESTIPSIDENSTPTKVVENVAQTPKPKSRWNTRLGWSRRPRSKTSGDCIGV